MPLSAVAKLTPTLGPLSVNHLGQLPAVTISFNLKPGTSIGDAVNEINNLARQALPPTTTTTFQGNAQAFESSLAGLGMLLVMAILVIYIILGILYESFMHPITILSGLPSAAAFRGDREVLRRESTAEPLQHLRVPAVRPKWMPAQPGRRNRSASSASNGATEQ